MNLKLQISLTHLYITLLYQTALTQPFNYTNTLIFHIHRVIFRIDQNLVKQNYWAAKKYTCASNINISNQILVILLKLGLVNLCLELL